MKVRMIKNLDKFFETIRNCKGAVTVVSDEGDNLILNSKLCQFVLASLVGKDETLLDNLEIKTEYPEDAAMLLNFLMNDK